MSFPAPQRPGSAGAMRARQTPQSAVLMPARTAPQSASASPALSQQQQAPESGRPSLASRLGITNYSGTSRTLKGTSRGGPRAELNAQLLTKSTSLGTLKRAPPAVPVQGNAGIAIGVGRANQPQQPQPQQPQPQPQPQPQQQQQQQQQQPQRGGFRPKQQQVRPSAGSQGTGLNGSFLSPTQQQTRVVRAAPAPQSLRPSRSPGQIQPRAVYQTVQSRTTALSMPPAGDTGEDSTYGFFSAAPGLQNAPPVAARQQPPTIVDTRSREHAWAQQAREVADSLQLGDAVPLDSVTASSSSGHNGDDPSYFHDQQQYYNQNYDRVNESFVDLNLGDAMPLDDNYASFDFAQDLPSRVDAFGVPSAQEEVPPPPPLPEDEAPPGPPDEPYPEGPIDSHASYVPQGPHSTWLPPRADDFPAGASGGGSFVSGSMPASRLAVKPSGGSFVNAPPPVDRMNASARGGSFLGLPMADRSGLGSASAVNRALKPVPTRPVPGSATMRSNMLGPKVAAAGPSRGNAFPPNAAVPANPDLSAKEQAFLSRLTPGQRMMLPALDRIAVPVDGSATSNPQQVIPREIRAAASNNQAPKSSSAARGVAGSARSAPAVILAPSPAPPVSLAAPSSKKADNFDSNTSWFFPRESRAEAEERLRNSNSNSFLVRASSIANAYALTKYSASDGVIEHLLIQMVAGDKWHLNDTDDKNFYATLEHLVSYTPYLKGYSPIGDVEEPPPPPPPSDYDQQRREVMHSYLDSIVGARDRVYSGGPSIQDQTQPVALALRSPPPDVSWMSPLVQTQSAEYFVETTDPTAPSVEESKPKLIDADANTAYYDHYFFGKPHMLYVGKVPPASDKDNLELIIACVESFASSKTHEMPTQLRILVKSKIDEHWAFVDFQTLLKGGGSKKAIGKAIKGAMALSPDPVLSTLGKIDKLTLALAADESDTGSGPLGSAGASGPFSTALANIERMVMQAGYKFGVLYTRPGQLTEDEWLSNREEESSVYFQNFLTLLGARIKLRGWNGYRGGLNVRDDSTGTESIFVSHEGVPVMFHVSTLLPFQENDVQRVERKRHLGNDVVMIVFRDPGDSMPFDPSSVKSEFNHVFLVIQPVGKDRTIPDPADPTQELWYRLQIITRDATSAVTPPVPEPAVFRHSEHLQYFILTKLINGERQCMNQMSRFKRKVQDTKKIQMRMLVEEHCPALLKK